MDKKLDHGSSLAGNVNQEFLLEQEFMKDIRWAEFLASACGQLVLNDQGKKITQLQLENGEDFSVGQKQRPEKELLEDFDRQCGCTDSLRPCSNVANILGFVWFGGCCVPEGCSP